MTNVRRQKPATTQRGFSCDLMQRFSYETIEQRNEVRQKYYNCPDNTAIQKRQERRGITRISCVFASRNVESEIRRKTIIVLYTKSNGRTPGWSTAVVV